LPVFWGIHFQIVVQRRFLELIVQFLCFIQRWFMQSDLDKVEAWAKTESLRCLSTHITTNLAMLEPILRVYEESTRRQPWSWTHKK
jgi:hypothetical protein